jgi:hypothetical protein
LQTFENSPADVNSVLQGEIYGARFSLDGSWNRAQVVNVSGDRIVVQFLDFGNKDTVKFDDLRQLTNEMMILPAQVCDSDETILVTVFQSNMVFMGDFSLEYIHYYYGHIFYKEVLGFAS